MPRWAMVLGLLLLPVILGAWGDVSGNTINPRYVAKIKDGQTTKHEILLYFGEPKEVERTSEGTVFKYYSYVDAPPLAMKSILDREINPQSTSSYVLDPEHKIKKVKPKTESTVLRSTLTIYFKPDGQTVLRHEYKEVK
jgi:outer membrane protein assembly factor BamE (lipoprotein component of BamABCDE complex)